MAPPTFVLPLPRRLERRVRWRTCAPDPEALAGLGLPLWVACGWEHQPPGGLLEACDTRLQGALTRGLRSGSLSLAHGEVALVGGGTGPGAPLLMAGLGALEELDAAGASGLGRDLANRVHLLRLTTYGLEPPTVGSNGAPLAASFMAAHLHRRLTLLGSAGVLRVTWILPPAVRLAVRTARGAGRGGKRSPRRDRAGRKKRRCRRGREVTFFRGLRKK